MWGVPHYEAEYAERLAVFTAPVQIRSGDRLRFTRSLLARFSLQLKDREIIDWTWARSAPNFRHINVTTKFRSRSFRADSQTL